MASHDEMRKKGAHAEDADAHGRGPAPGPASAPGSGYGGTYRGSGERGERSNWYGDTTGSRRDPPEDGRADAAPDGDAPYLEWREAQVRRLDADYRSWKQEGAGAFPEGFEAWRRARSPA